MGTRWKLEIKYSEDQLRVPAGQPGGGRWTSGEVTAIEAGDLYRRTLEAGGFTYNPIHDDSPEAGYALSIYPEAEKALNVADLSVEVIFQYLVSNRARFEDPETYVGGWFDRENGIVYLDISVVVRDLERAMRLAKKHNQEGIYDLGQGETIIVKAEEERRRAVGAPQTKEHQ